MAVDAFDAEYVRGLLDAGAYPQAYRHMASAIRNDPTWDQRLADWADRAADINGPDQNFYKDWVFSFNAVAAGRDPSSAGTQIWNQNFSNQLAINALNDFATAAEAGVPLQAAQIFNRDVIEAVGENGLDNPGWAWAGGPIGIGLFGFPLAPAFDERSEWLSWLANALGTIPNLSESYVVHAARLLIDTLDEFKDFLQEINEIYDASYLLDQLGDLLRHFRSDPLVLDLDGNGITLTALDSSNTRFDVDGDGAIERVGWVGPNDGLLVLDANQNGLVDGIDELIGNTHIDGFDELATLDSNGDGKIDQQDTAFSKLLVWRDSNGDGISSSSEMLTTAQAGISQFKLAYTSSGVETGGNLIARVGSYTLSSGVQRAMGSVQFAKDETVTRPTLPNGADLGEIATLPNLGGYGPIADLRTSMFHDPILKAMVLNLITQNHDFETFKDFLDGGFLDILFRWAGIDRHAAGETSASLKEKLIESLTGESLFDLSASQQARVDDVFNSIIGRFGVGFLVQAADRPTNMLMIELGEQLSNLDSNDPAYLNAVVDLTATTLSDVDAAQLPYEYLEKFSRLSLDPNTGAIVGDFDAFTRDFIKDQPSFNFIIAVPAGGAPPAPQPDPSGFIMDMIGPEGEPPEDPFKHPWLKWYEDEGLLLYNVASAMGIGGDYAENVSGWQWLTKLRSAHYGTSGDDILSFGDTMAYYNAKTSPSSTNGGLLYQPIGASTNNQRIYGFEGNDEIRGNDGIDTLIGGLGNDLLYGGAGSDMYVYTNLDGLDRITESSGDDDAIFFSNELRPADLRVIRLTGTNDLQLHFGDSSTGIILTNQVTMGNSAVERFSFVGVQPLDAGDIATIYLRSLTSERRDVVSGTAAGESIYGLSGSDTLSGLDGDDTIFGGDDNDTISGGNGIDLLNGDAGYDLLYGNAGNDVLTGGTGNDVLSGNDGNDTYVFNADDGQDVIADDGNGDDNLLLGTGIISGDVTVSQADNGNDLVLTFSGSDDRIVLNDTVSNWMRRIERVTFANGTVWTHAELLQRSTSDNSGNNVFHGSYDGESLAGGAGHDRLYGRGGNDVLTGGVGNDMLWGNDGDDTYVFNVGDGQDIIADDGNGNDTLQLGAGILPGDVTVAQADNGNDLVLTFSGSDDRIVLNDTVSNWMRRIERVTFANGTVWTHAELLQRSTSDNSGSNVFHGSYDGESLAGGAGHDKLYGRGGNDVLTGGVGNDMLWGNDGDDTYVFNVGDGQDIIADDGNGNDTLQLGAGILPSDVTVAQADNGNDLVLTFSGSDDRIVLNDTVSNWMRRIERVTFANGTVWTHAELLQRSTSDNSGNNVFHGSYDGESLAGGAGHDKLYGRGGNDILTGGVGNDLLSGNDGDDIYVFNVGDGQDIIADDGNGNDTLQLGTGILPGDVTVARADNGNDLVLTFSGSDDRIVLNDTVSNWTRNIERVTFANGIVWTHADLLNYSAGNLSNSVILNGTASAETLSGSSSNDLLNGRGGDDILIGGTGSDFLVGGGGNDTYRFNLGDGQDTIQEWSGDSGWGGNDTIEFGAGILASDIAVTQGNGGSDLILTNSVTGDSVSVQASMTSGDNRIEQVRFNDGTIWTHADLMQRSMLLNSANNNFGGSYDGEILNGGAGDDLLNGRGGDDILIGGTGSDFLVGGGGNDTYRFNLGDGQDTIQEWSGDSGWGGNDTIEFGAGILASDIVVTQGNGGSDLVLTNSVTGDSVSAQASMTSGDNRIEQVRFNDGTIWSHADLMQRSMLLNSANNNFGGSYDGEVLDGGAGDDHLNGRGGDDILVGGTGSDFLVGGGGNDTYRFNLGDGQDTIQEWSGDSGWGGNDTIEFGAGISASDIVVTQGNGGSDLVLTNSVTGDSVSVQASMTSGDNRIEQVRFNDGTIWSHADLMQRSMLLNSANNNFSGSYDGEVLNGGAGDDHLNGRGGDDILIGGTGSDFLVGGGGNDTYRFNLGDGQDTIREWSGDSGWGGNDTIEFGAGISASDIVVTQGNGGSDLVLTNSVTGDSVLIQATVTSGDNRIEQVRFNDGTIWNSAQLVALSQQATDGDDILYGYGGADILAGGSGNDQLYGGDGADTLVGGAGADILNGGNGIDTIDYSYGVISQTINLNISNAQTISLNDDDTITNVENVIGGSGNDTIIGNNASNILNGGMGDDRLTGGIGNDTIIGGLGSFDVAVFAGIQESYTITTNSGAVTITDNQTSIDGNDGVDTLIGIEIAEFKGGAQIGIASPIILDLNGNGVSLIENNRTNIAFDWNGDSRKEQTGWIGKDDGFLFIDRDGNGTVTNAGELSFTNDKKDAKSDLDGLRAFDSNGDGIFSSADDQFSQFKIWRDKNGNGRVDKKEILSLDKAGIASLDLAGEAVNQSWEWGENITIHTGSFIRTNGTIGAFSDVALNYDVNSDQYGSVTKAASQLSEAISSFWNNNRGTAEIGKLDYRVERWDNMMIVDRN